MSGIISTGCRNCANEITLSLADIRSGVTCSNCRHSVPLRMDPALENEGIVRLCVACGHDTLYIQKDFNRNLGLAIVVVGSLASLYFFFQSRPIIGMLALFISAAVDFAIYTLVGEVTVCYACHTIYRGWTKNPSHGPFDLKDLEKYGGRDPRF